MQIKKNIKLILGVCGAFCVLYTFFAVRPLSSEISFKSEWTVNVIKSQNIDTGAILLPFKLGQTLGYFTPQGQIALLENFSVKATITKDFYSCFGYDSTEFSIFDNTGKQISSIEQPGFPFFEDNRIYVMSPGGAGVMQTDLQGKEIWRFESYCPLTAFSSSQSGSIAGFADGNIYAYTKDGRQDASYSPGGSKYPVILGVALSNNGEYSACVSGHEKQRFVLSKKSGAITKAIFHEYLLGDTTQQMLVKFSSDDKYVYYNYKDGLGMHNIKTGKTGHIKLAGSVLDIKESSQKNLIFVLSVQGDTYTVSAIEPVESVIGSFSFKAKNAFIQTQGDSLFVGRDDQISKIQVTKQ